ncbi:MAG: membrane dipeptidase [Firmicutes bacterium]|nr:membrane dipeptidase [Bacillota bacterium]
MRIDTHWDTPMYLLKTDDLWHLPEAQADLQRLTQHIDVGVLAIYLDDNDYLGREADTFRFIQKKLNASIAMHADQIAVLHDRKQLAAGGKYGIIAAEGGRCLGAHCENLSEFFENGMRWLGLTWNYCNALAGGAKEENDLTEVGKQVVKRCGELGIVVDTAHLGETSFWQLVKFTDRPIVCSHTACRHLCPEAGVRAFSDEQLKAVAALGGVTGMCFVPSFLGGQPGVARVADHIEHAAEVAGIDHVGLGSDLDGCQPPVELNRLEKQHVLWDELKRRGWKEEEIDKVAGNNFRRVLQEVLPK